jgi:hypothetical protein
MVKGGRDVRVECSLLSDGLDASHVEGHILQVVRGARTLVAVSKGVALLKCC